MHVSNKIMAVMESDKDSEAVLIVTYNPGVGLQYVQVFETYTSISNHMIKYHNDNQAWFQANMVATNGNKYIFTIKLQVPSAFDGLVAIDNSWSKVTPSYLDFDLKAFSLIDDYMWRVSSGGTCLANSWATNSGAFTGAILLHGKITTSTTSIIRDNCAICIDP